MSIGIPLRLMSEGDEFEEKRYDLTVIGGGLSGVCAAISAARHGLKVSLVNDRPVLGGNSSSEIRVSVGGADHDFRWARESGIVEELRIEDRYRNHESASNAKINSRWDMVLWEYVKREDGIDLYLNTTAREAVAKDGRIESVLAYQLGNERAYRIASDLYIDASGDGQVAFSAGAEYRMGRESRDEFGESLAPERSDKKTMGSSLMFRAVDTGRPVRFERPDWAREYRTDQDLPFRSHRRLDAGHWWIELGGTSDVIHDNEEIRDELLACLFGVWDHVKNKGDHGAERLALDWIGSVPGKRESRRFMGDHILTQDDIELRRGFPDVVAYGGWPIDLHPPDGIGGKQIPADIHAIPGIYQIPFRCLFSRNVENLMMAGRNISVTHVALGSTRLIATGAVEGQAVGAAAYLCRKYGKTPKEVCQDHIEELQQLILRDDCYLPNTRNRDPGDLARQAKVTSSSDMVLEETTPDSYVALDSELGLNFPVSTGYLESIDLHLRCSSPSGVEASLTLGTANNWDDKEPTEELLTSRAFVPRGDSWVTFDTDARFETEYCSIRLDPGPDIEWAMSARNLIGVQRTGPGDFKKLRGTYLFKTVPESRPYGGENVINGVARPEGWPNIWISDPRQQFPQSLQLSFQEDRRIRQIRLTFDTDIDRLVDIGPVPQCVRTYSLSYRTGGEWLDLLRVDENHHRLVVHDLDPVSADSVRVNVLETWGSPRASIYEVRIY